MENKKLKIAYLAAAKNGLESFIYREISILIQRDYKVSVFLTRKGKKDIYSPKKKWDTYEVNGYFFLIGLIVNIIKTPIKFLSLLSEAIKYSTLLEFIVAVSFSFRMKRNKINHIHATFGDKKLFIGYYCKRFLSVPLSVTIHAHEIYANPNESFFINCIQLVDSIVAISERNKLELINRFNIPKEKIKVIRLSIDTSIFKEKNYIKILTVARYTERKGFKELFQAIQILDEPNVQFITVGFGPLNLEKMAKEYNIEDKVIIYGKMNPQQLSFMYDSCNIFCLPSKNTKREGSEGIPVVLMEAMASGMLVVATKNGSIPELVEEILVEEANPLSLLNGIKKAIKIIRNNESAIIGKKNRKKVLSEYNDSNIDKLIEYLYYG